MKVFKPDEAERMYWSIAELIRETPTFPKPRKRSNRDAFDAFARPPVAKLTLDQTRWLGTACALVEQCGDISDKVSITSAAKNITGSITISDYEHEIALILHKTLARLEMQAPVAVRGVFIGVGKPFDAFTGFSKVSGTATQDILIIDAYLDHVAMTDFVPAVPDKVSIRLLGGKAGDHASLKAPIEHWRKQYPGRPIEARIAQRKKSLHDRLIVIDKKTLWQVGQSYNQLGTRSPTAFQQVHPELVALKLAYYDDVWQNETAPL